MLNQQPNIRNILQPPNPLKGEFLICLLETLKIDYTSLVNKSEIGHPKSDIKKYYL
jgi:hypothetical protein